MKIYGYVRVSTKNQNTERQVEELKKYVNEEYIFEDKESGKNFDRPQYQFLRKVVREGDIIYVHSLDRLGRNKKAVKEELDFFKKEGVTLRILDIPTTMIEYPKGQEWILDMVNNLLIEVYSSIAEQERLTMKKRQAEGIAVMPLNDKGKRVSIKTGKPTGRPSIEYPSNWREVYKDWKDKKISGVKAMELTGLKKTSFYKLVKEFEGGNTIHN